MLNKDYCYYYRLKLSQKLKSLDSINKHDTRLTIALLKLKHLSTDTTKKKKKNNKNKKKKNNKKKKMMMILITS
jgi:hypothetical protein